MTKPKSTTEAALKSAKRRAGAALCVAITEQLRKAGPQTARQVHDALGGDFDSVMQSMYRMAKSGTAKSVRGPNRAPSTYHLGDGPMVPRNVANPHRPVHKEWPLNCKRDPMVAALFGAARA